MKVGKVVMVAKTGSTVKSRARVEDIVFGSSVSVRFDDGQLQALPFDFAFEADSGPGPLGKWVKDFGTGIVAGGSPSYGSMVYSPSASVQTNSKVHEEAEFQRYLSMLTVSVLRSGYHADSRCVVCHERGRVCLQLRRDGTNPVDLVVVPAKSHPVKSLYAAYKLFPKRKGTRTRDILRFASRYSKLSIGDLNDFAADATPPVSPQQQELTSRGSVRLTPTVVAASRSMKAASASSLAGGSVEHTIDAGDLLENVRRHIEQLRRSQAATDASFPPDANNTSSTATTKPTTSTTPPNWLTAHLVKSGYNAEAVKDCIEKLVIQEGFVSESDFAECSTGEFNREYLVSIGVTGLGLQKHLVKLHGELHTLHSHKTAPASPMYIPLTAESTQEHSPGKISSLSDKVIYPTVSSGAADDTTGRKKDRAEALVAEENLEHMFVPARGGLH